MRGCESFFKGEVLMWPAPIGYLRVHLCELKHLKIILFCMGNGPKTSLVDLPLKVSHTVLMGTHVKVLTTIPRVRAVLIQLG